MEEFSHLRYNLADINDNGVGNDEIRKFMLNVKEIKYEKDSYPTGQLHRLSVNKTIL